MSLACRRFNNPVGWKTPVLLYASINSIKFNLIDINTFQNLDKIVAIYQHIDDPSPTYSKILKDTGFEVHSCKTEIFHYEYPNVDGIISK